MMGDPFVGIVHPCKIYNIRTLGIPHLYIGPALSHIAEMNPTLSARHGDVAAVMHQIQTAADSHEPNFMRSPDSTGHSQRHLVAKMVFTLESLGRDQEYQIRRKAWQAKREY